MEFRNKGMRNLSISMELKASHSQSTEFIKTGGDGEINQPRKDSGSYQATIRPGSKEVKPCVITF